MYDVFNMKFVKKVLFLYPSSVVDSDVEQRELPSLGAAFACTLREEAESVSRFLTDIDTHDYYFKKIATKINVNDCILTIQTKTITHLTESKSPLNINVFCLFVFLKESHLYYAKIIFVRRNAMQQDIMQNRQVMHKKTSTNYCRAYSIYE